MITPEDVLHTIFNKEFDEPERNPNDPADQPFFSVKPKIMTQAYHSWLKEQGGEIALDDLRKTLRGEIIQLLNMPIKGFDNVFQFLALRQHIADDLNWYLRIVESFRIWEESKKELKGE